VLQKHPFWVVIAIPVTAETKQIFNREVRKGREGKPKQFLPLINTDAADLVG
jgi:hypothetical protein